MPDHSKRGKPFDADASEAAGMDPFSPEFSEHIHGRLSERVGKKRLAHIEGVAETARQLAEIHGIDSRRAYLAGMLHDWDKGMDNEAIIARVHELGIENAVGQWVMENMPEVIHGISASFALKELYPAIPDDVIHAIRVHTTACLDMSDLDKVIYIADAIEPGRDFEELETLRDMIGVASLDDLFFAVYKFWTEALISKNRALHPDTINIWNHYSAPIRLRKGSKKGAKKRDNGEKR